MNNYLYFACKLYLLVCIAACGRNSGNGNAVLPANGSAARVLNNKAKTFYNTNIDSVFTYADSAYRLANASGDSIAVAAAANRICEYHRRKGNFDLAMQFGLQALHLYRSYKQPAEEAGVLLQVGQLYKEMGGEKRTTGFLQQALYYNNEAETIYRRLADTPGLADAYNAKGIVYRDLSKIDGHTYLFDTAFNLYTRAVQLITASGKGTNQLAKLYNNISQVYIEHRHNYRKALDYLWQAVAANGASNNAISLSHNYGNISQAWLQLGNLDSSLLYAYSMLRIGRQYNLPHRLVNAYMQLHKVWMARHNPDSAISYLKIHYATYDSLTNLGKTGQISEMQARFEAREKEASIAALNTINRSKSKSIAWLSGALVLIAALCVLAWWFYRRSQKQQRQIAAQSQKLELMMKELHHRVKNNLQIVSSLLSLQSYRVQDEKALQAIEESRQRVQAMSLIHQRLYTTDQVTAVNIKEYLTDLAEQLMAGFGYNRDNFTLHITTGQELLDVDKALPLGLIVNEVATNAFKYAYTHTTHPELRVELLPDGDNLVLTIADNGMGMDMQQWKSNTRSFGKQLINALGKQVRAQQQIDTTQGTRFTFIIPAAA